MMGVIKKCKKSPASLDFFYINRVSDNINKHTITKSTAAGLFYINRVRDN